MILWVLVTVVVLLALCLFVPVYLVGLVLRIITRLTFLEELGASGIGSCVVLVLVTFHRNKWIEETRYGSTRRTNE